MNLHFDFCFYRNSIILILSMVLFFVFKGNAQEGFQVKWSMDQTKVGTSNHANFSPSDAALFGGSNTYALNGGYGFGDAIGSAYVARPWPNVFSGVRYVEFKFSAKSFKYNITSISFRLRRSGDGPTQVKIRTSMDSFGADLNAYTIVNASKFNGYSIPVSFLNLTEKTFVVRIYAYNPTNIYGTLWLDEVIINGEVLAIVLPVDLTYFKALTGEGTVRLAWETAWERNSKEFVVERSLDLKAFTEIGRVKAAGETSGRTPYIFDDEASLPGIRYYRLRNIDLNEHFTLSNIASVVVYLKETAFHVFPNPASSEKLSLQGVGIDPEQLQLTDASGLRIYTRCEKNVAGFIDLYPVPKLLPGLYFLTYQKDGRKEHAKVLVP
jgi:hypothetical protein